jgi:hypothetical protein
MGITPAHHWSHRRPLDPRRTGRTSGWGAAATKNSTKPSTAFRTKCLLRRSQGDGVVVRHVDSDRVDTASLCQFTELGRSLDEPLSVFARWVDDNRSEIEDPDRHHGRQIDHRTVGTIPRATHPTRRSRPSGRASRKPAHWSSSRAKLTASSEQPSIGR